MRIKHLFEYAEASIKDFLNPEVVNEVKKTSSKFINEFLKNNIFIYRGNDDDLPHDELHVVPTMSYRRAHGNIFFNTYFKSSLEQYLSDHDIPSRYKHAVSTIAFDPSEFDGVEVGVWYYFIPKGPYRYHYYSNVTNGDINVNNPDFQRLAKVSWELSRIYYEAEALTQYRRHVYNNIDKIFDDRDEKFVDHLYKIIDKLIDVIKHPMEIQKNDIMLLDRIAEEADEVLNVHPSEESDELGRQIYKGFFDTFSRLWRILETHDVYGTIEKFRNSFVVDEITDSIKKSEIVFQCEEYYIVPMNDDGEEFLRRLIK
jgi:hypothetical protein